uniref:Coenzyme Q-binding protein COQ10 START domain-containing protein n=1 Tax=Chlamydomonas leiostraca TaxID=1034604 RepID=A0A7S0RTQ8_9CHLO|mmetsp:Transcript_31129/g.79358  ORF Transcript_31129/g.79358 Transcript_31129/m.79358 type:complete len:151 (+) Transcript_31129:108-560(+)
MPSRQLSTELEITAPPARVFDAFGDFVKMSKQQSWLSIKSPDSITDASVGSRLDVTLTPAGGSPFSIQPEVVRNEPGAAFAWRGKLWGSNWLFVGEHSFQFQPLPGNKTKLVHSEHFSGLLIPLLGSVLRQAEQEFNKFNQVLKAEAEGK